MTVVAWDGFNLAAEMNTGFNAVSRWKEKKIFEVNEYLVAYTGINTGVRDCIINWLFSGRKSDEIPVIENEKFTALIIDRKSRKAYRLINNMVFIEFPYKMPISIGSIGLFAAGALTMGATAEEAVKTALIAGYMRPETLFHEVDILSGDWKPPAPMAVATGRRVRKPKAA